MKFPDSLIPAPLRKPAKPGDDGRGRGPAPANLIEEPPKRPSEKDRIVEGTK